MKENTKLTRQERIDVVNKIIDRIATSGRMFFSYKGDQSKITQRNGRLYMYNPYNKHDMCLSTKYGYPPKHFHHGGTLWGLTKDFKDYIITGEKSNHNNGYGGLYCQAWGYPEKDMEEIQELAKSLGYL
jgi:hypothetical protein